jgi:signal recognition particle receptor subunit beta
MFIKTCKIESVRIVGDDNKQDLDDCKTREAMKKAAQDSVKKVVEQAENEIESYKKLSQVLDKDQN